MEPHMLLQELESGLGKKLKLRINDNKSTMLSVKWEPSCTRVSLHRMFLEAPRNVMEDLACYLRREVKKLPFAVNQFINRFQKKLDYSSTLNNLSVKGDCYDLQEIYSNVNREYFNNAVDLNITWFGNPRKRRRTRCTFGLYIDNLKLVKIHRLLDSPKIPEYVVSFIMYHEMLHHVCPSYYDEEGKHRIHTKEFKQREIEFKQFLQTKKWIKEHHHLLFN